MARKKNGDHVRSITKTAGGKSFSVTLPITIIRALEWDETKKVCIRKWGKKVIIQDFDELDNLDC